MNKTNVLLTCEEKLQIVHFQKRCEASEIVSQEVYVVVLRDANLPLEARGNILFCSMVIFVVEGRTFQEDQSALSER